MRASLRLKRTLATVATGALALSLLPGVAFADAIDFSDVCEGAADAAFDDKGTTHAAAIDCMNSYNGPDDLPIFRGTAAGDAAPFVNVTRGQFASLLVRFALIADPDLADTDVSGESEFTDIEGTTHEANIRVIEELNLIDGFADNTFRPNADLNRGQAAKILYGAHTALGVDFAATYDEAFEDEGDTFGEFIRALSAFDIVEGTTATTFEPFAPVQRGPSASLLARSAQVLDNAGLWPASLVAPSTLRVVDANTGSNLVYVSDGEAVTEVDYTGDSFQINGSAASTGAFETFLADAPDVLIESTVDGDDVTHNVTEGELVLEGTLGNGDTGGDNTGLAIVDAPSGVILTNITNTILGDELYTVDGSVVNEATFVENLSVGDSIEVEVVAAGDNDTTFADYDFRHNLTNETLSGVATNGALTVNVDPNADDDATAALGFPLFDVAADLGAATGRQYIINGNSTVQSATDPFAAGEPVGDDYIAAGFDIALEAGLAVSFGLESNVATYEVTTTAEPAVSGLVVDGAITLSTSSTESETIATPGAGADVTVNGVTTTVAEFNDALSLGDSLTYQPADAGFDITASWDLTDGTVDDARVIESAGNTQTILLSNGFETNVDVSAFAFGGSGSVGYSVNGSTQPLATTTGILDAVNLVTNDVRLTLDQGATTFTYEVTGVPAAQLAVATVTVATDAAATGTAAATVVNANGDPLQGVSVSFTATGTTELAATSAVTDATGVAGVGYSAGTAGDEITATAGGVSDTDTLAGF